jgi:NCS2 family nucleobase:cation symporter-2
VVTGTIITLIGVSLMPVAARWAAGGDPTSPDYGAARSMGLAFSVLCLILLYSRALRGFWRNIAVLLGLCSGTLIAVPLGLVHLDALVGTDWLGVTTPLHFGAPTFDLPSIASMTLVMLVVMVETTGDFVAVSEIVGRPLSREDLVRGLRADGLSTVLGGLLNAFPYTAYAQNVGLVGLTRIKSRWVVAAAGAILMLLGLFPKAAAVVASIPLPVLGGAGLVMFGSVAASGLRTLAKVEFSDEGHEQFVVALGLALGLLPQAAGDFHHRFPQWAQPILNSGITLGSTAAILCNVALRPWRRTD